MIKIFSTRNSPVLETGDICVALCLSLAWARQSLISQGCLPHDRTPLEQLATRMRKAFDFRPFGNIIPQTPEIVGLLQDFRLQPEFIPTQEFASGFALSAYLCAMTGVFLLSFCRTVQASPGATLTVEKRVLGTRIAHPHHDFFDPCDALYRCGGASEFHRSFPSRMKDIEAQVQHMQIRLVRFRLLG